jgi:hypothetical protein
MKRDVQNIPPAPRRVRWSTVLAFRWPLALIAGLLAFCPGGVLTWMLFLARDENDDYLLDRGPTERVDAKVLEVLPEGELDGPKCERATYEFVYARAGSSEPPTVWKGASFVATGTVHAGEAVKVDLLPTDPSANRLVGGRANLQLAGFHPEVWFYAMVLPGAAMGLFYLFGALRLRRILVHGDVGVATGLGVVRVRRIIPEMWSVRFRFRDRNAAERAGRHWVRAHSALGQRLQRIADGSGESLPVLHDRRRPARCRLVLPDAFVAEPQGPGRTAPVAR